MDEHTNVWENYSEPAQIYGTLRSEEKRSLKRQSIRAGLCLIAFLGLEYALSRALVSAPALYELYLQNDTVYELVEMFFYLFCMLLPFTVAYLTMRPAEKDELTLFGKPTSKPAAVTAVMAGFLVCNAANYVTNIVLVFMENAGFSVGGGTYDAPQTGVQLVFSILTVGLLPAFVEEFALRGIVMQPMRKHGDLFAVLMSALVFALMHGNLSQFLFAFIVGAAIGYFVTATGSIWVGVAIHMLNNLYSVALDYLLEVRPTVAEKFYNLELSITLVVGAACLVLFFTVCRRNKLQKSSGVLTGGEKTAAYIFTVPMVGAILWLVVETVRLISFEGS
ncbi:MAG: CPBP family intramembrane metalloprotease [Clostridia bacterium]|nr:CPBP family intramembrane metalloprotease [Clostridia bacterium]